MTLSKKNSRPITVKGRRYRYTVNLSSADHEGMAELRIVVQLEEGTGSKLIATRRSRNYWLDFPDVREGEYPVIKPRDVARMIDDALSQGWSPESAGSPFELDLEQARRDGVPSDAKYTYKYYSVAGKIPVRVTLDARGLRLLAEAPDPNQKRLRNETTRLSQIDRDHDGNIEEIDETAFNALFERYYAG